MNPSIEALQNPNDYESIEVWEHASIVSYIQKYLNRTTWLTIAYYVLNIFLILMLVIRWIMLDLDFWDGLAQVGYGLILGYFLIIPHEHIHGWFYRYLGCKNIKIVYNWRQLTAVCLADREVVTGKQLAEVAIAPFLVLSGFLLVLCLIFPQTLIFWSAFAFHTSACSGDFAIINFVNTQPRQPIFTYDDADEKKSYFYRPLA